MPEIRTTKADRSKSTRGFGLAESEFEQRFIGSIDNITLGKSGVNEVVDLLKSLATIEVPPKLDIKLTSEATASQTTLVVSDVTGLDSPSGYVRIADEIIYYTGVNTRPRNSPAVPGVFSPPPPQSTARKTKCRRFATTSRRILRHLERDAPHGRGHGRLYVDSPPSITGATGPEESRTSAIVSEPEARKLYFEIMNPWTASPGSAKT